MRNWTPIRQYQEILFDQFEGIARITINRPRYRNAFTPTTVMEISNALSICREDADIRVVVLTGAHSPGQEGQTEAERLRTEAFCSGGDMHVKGRGQWFCSGRWSRAAFDVRPDDCFRECQVWTDGTESRFL